MPLRLPVLHRRRIARRVGAAALAVVLLVPLSGCSGDDDEPSGDEDSTSSAPDAPAVTTQATAGEVVGRLPAPGPTRVTGQVGSVIDRWWDKAYVGGEFPRASVSGAFDNFTPRAAGRARRNLALLSNAEMGRRLTSVEAVTRRVDVDVLAVKKRPVAATARVTLLMQLAGDGIDRRDRVSGRVFLTFEKGAWRIFGYDLRREMAK